MSIAFIADVHANAVALDAVLDDARSIGVSRFVCCGDLVGLGAQPNETLRLLVENDVQCVRGNVDHNVARVVKRQKRYLRRGKFDKFLSYGWTWNVLTPNRRRFLAELPRSVSVAVGGLQVLCLHGTPRADDEYLDPNMAEELAPGFLEEAGVDVIAAGHTHVGYVTPCSGGWWVSTGAVGMAGERPCTAEYVVMRCTTARAPTFEGRCVSYDGDALLRATLGAGLPRLFADMLTGTAEVTRSAILRLADLIHDPRYRAE